MYGEFFRKKFEKNNSEYEDGTNYIIEDSFADVVFIDPDEIIEEYYEKILNADSKEEIYELLLEMHDVVHIESSKALICAYTQASIDMLNILQNHKI